MGDCNCETDEARAVLNALEVWYNDETDGSEMRLRRAYAAYHRSQDQPLGRSSKAVGEDIGQRGRMEEMVKALDALVNAVGKWYNIPSNDKMSFGALNNLAVQWEAYRRLLEGE